MDEVNNCPENDAMLLQVVFYTQKEIDVPGTGNWTETLNYTEAQPIANIGLNKNIRFEDLMDQIEKAIKK